MAHSGGGVKGRYDRGQRFYGFFKGFPYLNFTLQCLNAALYFLNIKLVPASYTIVPALYTTYCTLESAHSTTCLASFLPNFLLLKHYIGMGFLQCN